jgi:hypothetical protein
MLPYFDRQGYLRRLEAGRRREVRLVGLLLRLGGVASVCSLALCLFPHLHA